MRRLQQHSHNWTRLAFFKRDFLNTINIINSVYLEVLHDWQLHILTNSRQRNFSLYILATILTDRLQSRHWHPSSLGCHPRRRTRLPPLQTPI